jgi:hypothetical protein
MPASQLPSAEWRKSRFSNPSGNCVEMARLPDRRVAVRNSRHPDGAALIFTPAGWAAFLLDIRRGNMG